MNLNGIIVVIETDWNKIMRKIFTFLIIFLISIAEVSAYSLKVYDEYGNRVGTYRKEGDKFQLYDFNDNKVDEPTELIKNPPTQKTLSEYSRTYYDENMLPIGTYRSGWYGNNGRYYPRGGYFVPKSWYPSYNQYIVRPSAGNIIRNESYIRGRGSTNIVPATKVDPFTNTLLKF